MLKYILIFFIGAVGIIQGNENQRSFCNFQNRCFRYIEGWYNQPQVHVIETDLADRRFAFMEEALGLMALDREVIHLSYLQSGNSEQLAKGLNRKDTGEIHGMQDDLASAFCSTLLYFGDLSIYLQNYEQLTKVQQNQVAQIVYKTLRLFKEHPSMRERWQSYLRVKGRRPPAKLLKTVLRKIDFKKTETWTNFYQRELQNKNIEEVFNNLKQWPAMLKDFLNYYIEKEIKRLPKKEQPDLGVIEAFLNQPNHINNIQNFLNKINVSWRNKRGVKYLNAALKRSKALNKALFITINTLHLPFIDKYLREQGERFQLHRKEVEQVSYVEKHDLPLEWIFENQ